MRLIGLCGRKQNGKSVLSNIAVEKFGFHKLAIADSLKDMICKLLNIDRTKMEEIKNDNTDISFQFNDDSISIVSNETGIDKSAIEGIVKDKTYDTVRDMLQLLGTELIRELNPNWHVQKTTERINKLKEEYGEDVKIIIDDIRFPNELQYIYDNNGESFFIIRPDNWNVSNHASEKSITWDMMNDKTNIIINHCTKEAIEYEWTEYLKSGNKNTKYYIFNVDENKFYGNRNAFKPSNSIDIISLSTLYFIGYITSLSPDFEKYGKFSHIIDEAGLIDVRFLHKVEMEMFCTIVGYDDYITEYANGTKIYRLTFYNPFIIENLKLYL